MNGLLYPKEPVKKCRKQHPKSLLHAKEDKTCYLCIWLEDNWLNYTYLEEHHIFFSKKQRSLSEQYGLKVYLCIRHHKTGPLAVHQNKRIRRFLEAKGQQAFEAEYGHEKFMEIFGQNYVYDDNLEPPREGTIPRT